MTSKSLPIVLIAATLCSACSKEPESTPAEKVAAASVPGAPPGAADAPNAEEEKSDEVGAAAGVLAPNMDVPPEEKRPPPPAVDVEEEGSAGVCVAACGCGCVCVCVCPVVGACDPNRLGAPPAGAACPKEKPEEDEGPNIRGRAVSKGFLFLFK